MNSESDRQWNHIHHALVLAFSLIVAGILVWKLGQLIMLTFFSILLAASFCGIRDLILEHTPIRSPVLALTIGILGVALVLLGLFWLSAATLTAQFSEISRQLPEAWERLRAWFESTPYGPQIQRQITRLDPSKAEIGKMLTRAGSLLSSVGGALSGAFIALILALFFAANPSPYHRGLVALFPLNRRARMRGLLFELENVLQRWIVGKLASMLFIGLVAALGLSILGVQPVIALAFIAGILAFIPFLGPIVASVPGILLAFMHGPTKALWAIFLYIGIEILEGNVVSPLVDRRTIWIPPAIVLLAQLVLGTLQGLLGVLVAPSLAGVLLVVTRRIYIEDHLGDSGSDKTRD